MSILIKGMEMPTEEYGPMTIKIYPNGHVAEYIGDIGRVWNAVPVPPHGDLIDRDAMLNRQGLKSYIYQNNNVYVEIGDFINFIEESPTIIESEVEE